MTDHTAKDYTPRDFLTAAVMKLSTAFLFATMAVQVRYLGDRFPVGQVIFFRAAFAFVPILIFYAVLGELSRSWQTQRFSGHVTARHAEHRLLVLLLRGAAAAADRRRDGDLVRHAADRRGAGGAHS